MRVFAKAGLLVLLAAVPSMAATQYYVLADWYTVNQGQASTGYYSAVADGQSVYSQLALNSATRIVRTDGLFSPATATTTTLVSSAQWAAATVTPAKPTGETNMTSFYGFSKYGSYLQFSDSITDCVWRMEKATGALTKYVSAEAIVAHAGGSASNLGVGSDTMYGGQYAGEMAFYESSSKNILVTTGPGTLATLVTAAQLTALGNVAVQGMGANAAGDLYWANSTNDAMYKRAADGTITTVLSSANFLPVLGATDVNFKDILPAPDGYVYFQDSKTYNILRFNESDPAGTLGIFMSTADLFAGPAGSDTKNIYCLSWYEGALAFNVGATTGARGFYGLVPEPASLGLLALGGVMALRRRSR